MIWIRADANSTIGTGHVMRCLSVAAALQESGESVCFLTADDSAVQLLKQHGQNYQILHTAYDKMEEELPELRRLALRQSPCICLVDSYFVTPGYLDELGRLCRTAYLDDLFRQPLPVDLLINYNIYGDQLSYRENWKRKDTRFLLGTDYVPLRQEFCRRAAGGVRACVRKVLLTTGGSDRYFLAGQILKAAMSCAETAQLEYHVVSGAFNPHLAELEEMAEKYPGIRIHRNVSKMAELMRECDIAVTAGGSTMYELCAVGIPVICFSFVDNQEKIVETFAERKLVCYGGNYLQEKEHMVKQLVEHLCRLSKDLEARESYSERECRLVDGLGAKRIAEELLGYC